jgi:hypothetical protein
MSKFSFWFSIFALFVSVNVGLMTLSSYYRWAGDALYEVSTWSQDRDNGMTLNLYGIVPVAYCYLGGGNIEAEKRCVIGSDRYWRFHRPSDLSGG